MTTDQPAADELDPDDPRHEWMRPYRCTGMVDCSDVSESNDQIPRATLRPLSPNRRTGAP